MPAVAGPRVHGLSVVTVGFLAVFVAAVLALVGADVLYIVGSERNVFGEVIESPELRYAIRLSIVTTAVTLVLVALFAVPVGYALSRYRFPGAVLVDVVVDLPIVLPPIVVGVSLLVLFGTPSGRWIQGLEWPGFVAEWIDRYTWLRWLGEKPFEFVYTPKGIVLCQFLVSASYGIRAAKSAFDAVDVRLEELALTLGCTRSRAFRMVVLPMARNGLAAGAVMAWARAVGIFGPLMVFAGAVPMRTEVMPTSIYLELSVGRIEPALAIAMLMLALAMVALTTIHLLGLRHRWWGP